MQFDKLNWRVLQTEHFDLHYYDTERDAAYMAGRMAERSYARLSRIFNHQFRERKPIIVFASRGDFAQNNVFGDLGEATGGVTDQMRQRNMFFFAGDLKEAEHVMAHEMVHQFQYDIFARGRAGANLANLQNVNAPAWFIEGMAEYLSIGPNHPATDAIMRDAALNGNIPTIEQMTNHPEDFFPYRYGEAFLAYVAKRWGDDVIGEIMQSVPAGSVDRAFTRHTGLVAGRTRRGVEGGDADTVPAAARDARAGAQVRPAGPERAPDRRHHTRVRRARALARRPQDRLPLDGQLRARRGVPRPVPGRRDHRQAHQAPDQVHDEPRVRGIARGIFAERVLARREESWCSPPNAAGMDILYVLDVGRGTTVPIMAPKGIDQMIGPSFSPDGRQIVFSGSKGGISDLYVIGADGSDFRPARRTIPSAITSRSGRPTARASHSRASADPTPTSTYSASATGASRC